MIIVRFQGWSQSSPTREKTAKKVCVGKHVGSVKKFECLRNETERIKCEIR